MAGAVTVADCERVQAGWFRARAARLGGRRWQDGPLDWLDGPDGLSLMFPTRLPADAVARGVAEARRRDTGIGVWLGLEVDASALLDAGFEEGWSPWWMTAPCSAVGAADDERVELLERHDEDPGAWSAPAMTAASPRDTWYAVARESGVVAGRAWSHRVGPLAGVFDMDVWPPHQRHGLGTGLLRAVCAAAAAAGAAHAVLNATPDGERLYATCGFRRIGEGITWWLHPSR